MGLITLLDIFLQWIEHQNNGSKLTWDNYDGWRTVKRAALGGVAGAGIGYGIYQYKISEEAKIPFSSDNYLKKLLSQEHLKSDPILYQKVRTYREDVKKWLAIKFGNSLASRPEDTGSFYKRTAINSNYDLDIVLPFRKSSYSSLEDMYESVFKIIGEKFHGRAKVTRQTKAIGLTFENEGNPIHFDIVPGREINNYIIEKDLNLYVNPAWSWQKGSSFKTNVSIQKNMTTNKPEARTSIKFLKAYRDRNELPLPTIMIEHCVVSALSESNYGVHPSPTENFLNCMEYISTKLEQKKLIDTANSNNNLINKLTELERSRVSTQLRHDMCNIQKNPRYISEIFEI